MNDEVPPRKRPLNIVGRLTLALFLLCVLMGGASIFFYKKYEDAQSESLVAQTNLVEKLSRTVHLPNEKPTIVTVADKHKLSNKILAARVEDKDILLIFSESKRLLVYRPSSEKLIDMLSFANKSELPDGAQPPAAAETN